MKIGTLKRSGTRQTYSAAIADEDGNKHYELSICGSPALVEKVFATSDFEVEIAPRLAKEEFDKRSSSFLRRHLPKISSIPAPAHEVAELIGRKAPRASAASKTILIYLRRTEGEGTFWAMFFPALTVPVGTTLFFVLPRVWTTWSIVVPFAGNPNLFLALGPPPAPTVSGGTLSPGLTVETAAFTTSPLPWTHFAAWHRVVAAAPRPTTMQVAVVGHSLGFF